MKKIMILATVLYLTSCGQTEPTTSDNATPVAEAPTAGTTDTTQVDGISGATNVANTPSFNGIIVLPPQQQATITLTMNGVIHSTSLIPGNYVRKGEIIATLDNPDFIVLQQNYLDAMAQTEYLEKEYRRQQTLSSQEAASQKRFQQSKAEYLSMKSRLEAASAQLQILGVDINSLEEKGIQPYMEVKAPISGYVTNMNINLGKYLNAGEPICDVIDKSNVLIQLTAYEKDLAYLKQGSYISFHVNGMGNKIFEAELLSVDQMVDNENRSIKVYAKVKNSDSMFRPGMYVNARIKEN